MNLLEVRNLRVSYGGVPAVRDFSFHVRQGEIVCFVGQNGAGKSSSVHAVAGVTAAQAEQLVFDGASIAGKTPEQIAKAGISLVPEGRRIFGRLTVRENLAAASGLRGGPASVRDLHARMLALFPVLERRLDALAGHLSGGEQQQLAIARAILTRPKLLIVDEPSLGLAPPLVSLVFSTLKQLREDGSTLLVVEQSARRALSLADRLYLLRSGSLVLEGASGQLRGNPDFEAGYFGTQAGAPAGQTMAMEAAAA